MEQEKKPQDFKSSNTLQVKNYQKKQKKELKGFKNSKMRILIDQISQNNLKDIVQYYQTNNEQLQYSDTDSDIEITENQDISDLENAQNSQQLDDEICITEVEIEQQLENGQQILKELDQQIKNKKILHSQSQIEIKEKSQQQFNNQGQKSQEEYYSSDEEEISFEEVDIDKEKETEQQQNQQKDNNTILQNDQNRNKKQSLYKLECIKFKSSEKQQDFENNNNKTNEQEIEDEFDIVEHFYEGETAEDHENDLNKIGDKLTIYSKQCKDNNKSQQQIDFDNLQFNDNLEDIPPVPCLNQDQKKEKQKILFKKNWDKKIQEKKIELEDFLLKKAESWITGYKQRYFVLKNNKLYYYRTQKQEKLKGCINFQITQCHIVIGKKMKFQIEIPKISKKIKIQALSLAQKKLWIDSLQQVIDYNKYKQMVSLNTIEIDNYLDIDSITEQQFLKQAETGDIILFKTDNFPARMQRKFTGTKLDHVGIVIKYDNGYVKIFDTSADLGVGLMEWNNFIDFNDLYSHVVLRKLIYDKKDRIAPDIMEIIGETLGKKYQITFSKLMKHNSIQIKENKNQKKKQIKNNEGFFCSELVAKVYKKVGLLPQQKSACQYWPIDFTQKRDLQLLQGAKLSNEISIILERHTKQ